jgi:hypothetical protein
MHHQLTASVHFCVSEFLMMGVVPLPGYCSDSVERPSVSMWCTCSRRVLCQRQRTMRSCELASRTLVREVSSHRSEVAYSIALGSSVAAFTLWDRPCHLHRNFLFFPHLGLCLPYIIDLPESDDYIPSKYHLSDRSTPPGGDDFVTYDGLWQPSRISVPVQKAEVIDTSWADLSSVTGTAYALSLGGEPLSFQWQQVQSMVLQVDWVLLLAIQIRLRSRWWRESTSYLISF